MFTKKTFSFISFTKVATATSLLLGMIATPALAFGPQSSTKASEWGFDFVEEFDGLRDWHQGDCATMVCGNQWNNTSQSAARMPMLANGTRSAWGYFSAWGDLKTAPAPWIGSETASGRKIWRGTKSATIDIGGGQYGPSRLGLYFGENGYRDFSLFYMVWIPKNEFPTSITNGVGAYTEGQSYRWTASWKFNNIEMGCDSAWCNGNPYGRHYITSHIQQYSYTPNGLLLSADARDQDAIKARDSITLNHLLGGWFGVEYRVTNNSSNTAYNLQMWVYDSKGNASKVMNGQTVSIHSDAINDSWDRFFFGGNNSNTYDWGPTMQSQYYVDDLIIDAGSKGQIGPRYFAKIGAQAEASPPSPPPAGTGSQIPNQ